MAKVVVVRNDPVEGTDRHSVVGPTTTNPPTSYSGTGAYQYRGAVTESLSSWVTIAGEPVAVVTSGSTLRADATSDHEPKAGADFLPPAPPPDPTKITFVPPTGVGAGAPSTGAGSALLTVAGAAVLLDGDTFDTCSVPGGVESATVTAKQQGFVTCSE